MSDASMTNTLSHTAGDNRARYYNGIDLVKFLCAILVFTIHISPVQGDVSGFGIHLNFWTQHFLCRLAVPFYFVCSGFFLFRKMTPDDLNTEAIKSYFFKIVRLLGFWHVLLFTGGTGHLWYLRATVIAVALVCVCLYLRIRFRNICLLASLLYAVGLLGDSYHGMIAPLENISVFQYLFKVYSLIFSSTRNGVFMGFIFVLMGAAFSWYRIHLQPRTALVGLVVSMLGLAAEVFLLNRNNIPIDHNMYLFLLPVTFFLFSFACAIQLKNRAVYKHLRNIGMFIYFSHMLIHTFASLLLSTVHKIFDVNSNPYQYPVSLFFTVLFAVLIEWLSCKDKFKWLNWILAN